MVLTLVLLPVAAAALMSVLASKRMVYLLLSAVFALMSFISVKLFISMESVSFFLPKFFNEIIAVADLLLLLYFVFQGIKFRNYKVGGLAVVQLILYLWAESIAPSGGSAEIIVDKLSVLMFLIINIVGGIIVIYSVRYMEDEAAPTYKKRLFVGGLLIFLAVMNAIVCANSMLLFFFLFEMTTLASYLLIGFRNDEISRANALRALWMNQIGGAVILAGTLVAILSFDTVMFDSLIHNSGGIVLLSVALVSMAALVKGASIPFDGWLLGAMVAPTPVSAMLHSATMVKIAPFLLLKLSPVLEGTLLGELLSVFGALVFVAASYLALSRSVLKEILGYSTVALLGLMMSLAAIGTEESVILAMVLMVFHALSKALLFLSAGVLEKQYRVKNVEDMKGMVHQAPKSVGFIVLGFISLTLPPFGLFMGKLFAIASVASLLKAHPMLLIVLLSMIIGSSLLVLLYFKISSALLSDTSDIYRDSDEYIPQGYGIALIMLSAMIITGGIGYIIYQQEMVLFLYIIPFLAVFALPSLLRSLERFDRTKPYHCGEKEPFDAALVYYEPSLNVKRVIYWSFGVLFVGVALAGGIS